MGDIIDSNICGPLSIRSFGNKRYIITFVDEWSRHVFATALKRKDDALGAFDKYRKFFEKQYGHQIKSLHSDNGGEYVGINEYLEENGIRPERNAPYTPEQNGIAERMNRTLVEMIRVLLKSSGLDGRFWVEALLFAVDIRNRCSTRALDNKTPLQVLTGKIPSIDHIRVFGSKVFMHIPKESKTVGEAEESSKRCS